MSSESTVMEKEAAVMGSERQATGHGCSHGENVFRRMVQEDADGVARVEAACMPVPWSRQSFWEEASHMDA